MSVEEWLGAAPILKSSLDVTTAEYRANRTAQLASLAALDEQLAAARAGGGPSYAERHHRRGRLLIRERIELLVDRDSPFLELSALAAWGTDFTVGASMLTGIGVVSGIECMLIGHDPTVRGGAMNPYTLRKTLRSAGDRAGKPTSRDQPGGVGGSRFALSV